MDRLGTAYGAVGSVRSVPAGATTGSDSADWACVSTLAVPSERRRGGGEVEERAEEGVEAEEGKGEADSLVETYGERHRAR